MTWTMESSCEEERQFLVGVGPRVRRYGTTSTPSASRPHYRSLAYHTVAPSDTLQGLALRYGSSVQEIRRLNKLWSNDALCLKEVVVVPVLSDDGLPSTSASNHSLASAAQTPTGSRKRAVSQDAGEQKDSSVSELLSRIDATIKSTAKNVEKLEREGNVDRVLDQEAAPSYRAHASSGYISSRGSSRSGSLRREAEEEASGGGGGGRESLAAKYDLSVRRSKRFGDGSSTDVRSEGSKILASLQKLQRAARGQDGFEELQ